MSLHQNAFAPPPSLVALAGGAVAAGLPAMDAALSSSASLALLRSLNATAFLANVVAVSIPGRVDDGAEVKKKITESSTDEERRPSFTAASILSGSRNLIRPSGWAFAIWGPIYLGEAAFAAAQFFSPDAAASALLPRITAPFVAANLFQSLWCASFRPSYGEGWRKYVSAVMLGGTAFSLSLVHSAGSAAASAGEPSWLTSLLVPLTMHFGWTSAAALLNVNGALAADESASPRSLVALGHASALLATGLGVGLTLARSSPAYGLTLAWALAACADGMAKRVPSRSREEEGVLSRAAAVQGRLCWAGSFACALAAARAGLA